MIDMKKFEKYIENKNFDKEKIDILSEKNLEKSFLINACPGNGKTELLVARLIQESLIKKDFFIIGITYTIKAAEEMKERIKKSGFSDEKIWLGTIHSFCLNWILKNNLRFFKELEQGFSIMSNYEKFKILNEIDQRITYYDASNNMDKFFSKNSAMIYINDYNSLNELEKKYYKVLREKKLIDFNMLLEYSKKVILDYDEVSRGLSNVISLLCLDEYQDTSEIQYSILSSILKNNKKSKVFIVGDSNQAIFTSLGGELKGKEELSKLFDKKIEFLQLENSYRSPKKIVDFFKTFQVSENNIVSQKKDSGNVYFEEISSCSNEKIKNILIFLLKEKNVLQKDICIVAPQKYFLKKLVHYLRVQLLGVNYNYKEMIPIPKLEENLFYFISLFLISKRCYRWSLVDNFYEIVNENFKVRIIKKREFYSYLETISNNRGEANLIIYLNKIFNELISYCFEENEVKIILKEKDIFIESLEIYLEEEKLPKTTQYFYESSQLVGGINICTIHATKGKQFDYVIATDIVNGKVPHKSIDDNFQKINESKKLLYVLSSRVRKDLFIINELKKQTTKELKEVSKDLYTQNIPFTTFNFYEKEVVIFDTETNGLKIGSVLSISAIKFKININTFECISYEKYDRFYYPFPGEVLSEEASKKSHGLTLDVISNKRSESKIQYSEFFHNDEQSFKIFCNGVRHFIGHNIKYDIGYVKHFLEMPHTFDTMESNRDIVQAKTKDGKIKSPKLEETAKFYKVPLVEDRFHESFYDVQITGRIFWKMLKENEDAKIFLRKI